MQRPVERLDAVDEPPQAAAADGVGATDAIVRDHDRKTRTVALDRDGHAARVGVLRHVRERLRGDVERGRLDRLGKPVAGVDVELDRHG